MRSLYSVLVMVSSLFILASCAERVTSEVTRFHQLAAPIGETIAIVALAPDKAGSLELHTYEKLIATKLEAIGYQVVEESDSPMLLAKLDYGISKGETTVRRWPRNFVHYHFYYGYRYPYYFGNYWDEPYTYSYTVYRRDLDLQIVDQGGQSLFEGVVSSVGNNSNLNDVMPYLVDAMFHNFPGESGVTKVVTIKRPKGDVDY